MTSPNTAPPPAQCGALDIEIPDMATSIRSGEVVYFLGAGVNYSQRFASPTAKADPSNADPPKYLDPNCGFLPTGGELAGYLKRVYQLETNYGLHAPDDDLVRIAQCAWNAEELDQLRPEVQAALQNVFDRNFIPTKLHYLLADIAKAADSQSKPVIFTTNYDDVMERACQERGEPYDLIVYHAERAGEEARFWHLAAPDRAQALAKLPPDQAKNDKIAAKATERVWNWIDSDLGAKLPVRERTIIFKIHGSVARHNPADSSFLLTEDDYIEYMIHQSGELVMPPLLSQHMKFSHFLFLGYGLRDWNLRIFLQRLWEKRGRNRKVWAIQKAPSRLDVHAWRSREVAIFDSDCEAFADRLRSAAGM